MHHRRLRGISGPLLALHCALAAAAVACGGGGGEPSPPGTGAPPGVVQIRGGERLGWNQSAPSVSAVRAHTFLFFVDGAPSSLADVRCADQQTQGGYECSGRLPPMAPGRHVLELAAAWNGQQSPRSPALTVMMGAALQPSSTFAADARGADTADALSIATGLGEVEWLTVTDGNGDALFVEGRRSVRVIEGQRILSTAAHMVERPADAIVGMAVDPHFARSRVVYLAWTELQSDGTGALNLSRFRLVGGALGERATFPTGLSLAGGAAAPIAVDQDGLIYVALPAKPGFDAGSDAGLRGTILRFTADGGVPATNAAASPMIARGFSQPTALAIDRRSGRLWISGNASASGDGILAIRIGSDEGAARETSSAAARGAAQPGTAVTALAIADAGEAARITVVSSGVARRARLAADGTAGEFETMRFGAPGAVTGLADLPDGRSFVSVAMNDRSTAILLTRD